MSKLILSVLVVSCLVSVASANPREWTSSNGVYKIKAEAIAFDEHTVVLKKENGDLVAVELESLSDEDREFVESKEAKELVSKSADKMQTWTAADGMKVRGSILAYGQETLRIYRQRGKVTVNETRFEKADPLHQKVLMKVLSRLEGQTFETERDLETWVKTLPATGKSYDLEGVLMRLESGDEIKVPFFMFSEEALEVLEPGWKRWLDQHESEKARQQEDLLMRTQAMEYQRDRAAQQQIEMLKLDLLQVATGVTNVWQVGLVPARGQYGRPLAVMVTAPNSQAASAQAMARYPGYIVGGVRKASY